MLPDRVSNPGPLTYESGALPIALRGPASCVLYIGLLWDFIHSGHKLCAYRIHIVGSETFGGICFEKHPEGQRYC